MKKNKISATSWKIIETIIMRYPERKQEYDEIVMSILESSPFNDGQPKGNGISNITESTVLRLNNNYINRMDIEIKAVENALDKLKPDARNLIEKRFWSEGKQKKKTYESLECMPMSERKMHYITHNFFENVGKAVGELYAR